MNEIKKYTSDEFLSMTDLEGRYELVSGELYDMAPAPNTEHQRLSKKLFKKIDSFIESHSGKCEVFFAPLDVRLNDTNTVQPDVFVVCDPDKVDEKRCNGAPDWVIEILSPSNSRHDTITKLRIYKETGVREYWIADPTEEQVLVYDFEAHPNAVGIYTFDDDITAGIYKDAPEPLIICVNKL